jgi:hypothetical protein
VERLDQRYWIRLLPWRLKNGAESKSAQIKFRPQLGIAREDDWVCLELQLVNRSSCTVWVQEVTLALISLDTNRNASVSTGHARYANIPEYRAKRHIERVPRQDDL